MNWVVIVLLVYLLVILVSLSSIAYYMVRISLLKKLLRERKKVKDIEASFRK